VLPPSGCASGVCGNGEIESGEQCDDGDDEFEFGEHCDSNCEMVPCGRPTHSTGDSPKSSDALYTLKAGVQAVACAMAVCDVNNSQTLTTTDALMVLKKSVGLAVLFHCPLE
jgi:hypothetical protein